MVPVNEQICAALAGLIGLPVCDTILVEIPPAISGEEMLPGYFLEAGIAHGSVVVDGAVEVKGGMDHRSDDSNGERHAGCFALYDWLWGQDEQWLRCGTDENRYYAHDLGFFFPGGPNWTATTLQANRDLAHPLGQSTTGLDPAEIARLADALDALTTQEIDAAMPNLPTTWPIDAVALAAVVDFAAYRARALPVAFAPRQPRRDPRSCIFSRS